MTRTSGQRLGVVRFAVDLGHGILPDTPPDAVKYVTDLVHERTQR